MSAVQPFRIAIPDADLTDLRERLHRTRWPERECVDDWSQGIPLDYTRNSPPTGPIPMTGGPANGHRTASISSPPRSTVSPIHFITNGSATCLPSVGHHPWLAGSIVEFHKGHQAADRPHPLPVAIADDAFHVVYPHCPATASPANRPKPAGAWKVAGAWETLMTRLGYQRYGAQGGDWGAAVTTAIGINGGHCAAISPQHAAGRPGALDNRPMPNGTPGRCRAPRQMGLGYSKQQATRPQTLGYGRPTLPRRSVGVDRREVLGLDRLRRASRERPDPRRDARQRDAVLADRVGHLLHRGCTGRLPPQFGASRTAASNYPPVWRLSPKDPARFPRNWCESAITSRTGPICPAVGASPLEQPDLFVDDVRAFFATIR